MQAEYFSRYPNDKTESVVENDRLVAPPYGRLNMALLDSTCGWISTASDIVRLLQAITPPTTLILPTVRNTSNELTPPTASIESTGRLLANETIQMMLSRPDYVARTSKMSIWYGLGLVVEDEGKLFWHSGILDGATSVVAHDDVTGVTWAALLNYRLEANDLGDFMRYIVRKVFVMTSELNDEDADAMDVTRLMDGVSKDGRNVIRLMVPDYKMAELLASVSNKHFRLVWIDAYDEFGYIFFNVIWTRNDGTKWRCYTDMTSSRYRKRFKARVAQGYRLSHVETYVSRRRLRYAAIFVKDVWPEWISYEGYSAHRHKLEFYRHLRVGYRLVVQSVTEYKGQLYIAAIYDKIFLGELRVRLGLSLAQFEEELELQVLSGRVLSYVQAYENHGLIKFSAIWSPRTTKYWAVSQSMTKYTLLNKVLEYAAVNIPLACVTAYQQDDILFFTALWR